jgi:hypothetical protein
MPIITNYTVTWNKTCLSLTEAFFSDSACGFDTYILNEMTVHPSIRYYLFLLMKKISWLQYNLFNVTICTDYGSQSMIYPSTMKY